MSKFRLKGTYTEGYNSIVSDEIVEVTLPLISQPGELKWGMAAMLNNLQRNQICPSEEGVDLLCLSAMVYLADTRISRQAHSQNSWTREIDIELPVIKSAVWNQHSHLFKEMLNYLTGDRWNISFVQRECQVLPNSDKAVKSDLFTVATLFSGGMDSLINAINHLERQHKLLLIGHAGDGNTKNAQEKLLFEFRTHYEEKVQPIFCDLWMVFDKKIIPNGGVETTTRSRSFLFIAFGCCVLSGTHGMSQLEIPENGLISLNVPLDVLRIGAHSTHTTHPFYLGLWNSVLALLDLNITLHNPYWNMTKGEMAEQCANRDFLIEVLDKSISCSSMTKSRWIGQPPQHCGHCVPCIIRRAAVHKAFNAQKEKTTYTKSDIKSLILNHDKGEGIQLRSFQMAISKVKRNPSLPRFLIHKSGKLSHDDEYLRQLAGVYYRGLMEVEKFIEDSIC